MKIMVVVASKHGSTREIAEVIAAELRLQKFSVDLVEAEHVNGLAEYNAVVFGSGVYAGNWLPEAVNFANHFQKELAQIPVWLFSSGPLGREKPQPQEDPDKLAASLGDVKARDHHIFVGKLDLADLTFAERMLVKAVRAPIGDFRNWTEIRAWAHSIASELRAANH
ncbi:MAG: flavodoxin domain-containing protein [Anaerolineae bacterium]|nr:flavodoxin domain-containing protein [Anaerolineae bacterium]